MSAREAADFLKAHVETVRRLARRGAIPAFKVGKDWRFRRAALQRWTEQVEGLERPERPARSAPPATGGGVLIVDDDDILRRLMAHTIERLGLRAREAADGAAGLEQVARQTPELILLDLVMPGMNGPAFLKRLRATHPELPVVIVTGYPGSRLMLEASRYCPLLLLPKPAERDQIARTVRAVLGGRVRTARGATS